MGDRGSVTVRPDEPARGSIEQRVQVWTVSVPLPDGADDAAVARTMEALAYLDARVDAGSGQRFIIAKVQAASHVDAVCYAVQRVLALLDGTSAT